MLKRLAVVAAICLGVASATQAEYQPTDSRGSDQVDQMMGRYNLYPAFEKLGRGSANALGGWLEIPLNIDQRFSKGDTVGSFFTGAAQGLVKGVVRTAVGVYEVATFFLPYPENFAPILPTLAYFQTHTKRKPLPLE